MTRLSSALGALNAPALKAFGDEIAMAPLTAFFGIVATLQGTLVEVSGLAFLASQGDLCEIMDRKGSSIMGEVLGFRGETALVMPFGPLAHVGPGCRVYLHQDAQSVFPSSHWLGRVINGLGDPIDHQGPVPRGLVPYALQQVPLPAHERRLVEKRLDVGIKALNSFVTLCQGQRMGIFAGSGVGKSVLLGQLARFTQADVVVIGMIGERGREVQEFIQKNLGPEGLAKSVVVVSTSDEPAPMRRRAAYLTLALAEYFRDQGASVLCLMDSVTRFAMALREIGLALGQVPATRGYTPSVFAELPRLLERAGPGRSSQDTMGDITGLFTVLVDGDDHNEPISDAIRGILDGHIVLDRAIAEAGRFPAIDILKSVSRMMPECHNVQEQDWVKKAREWLKIHEDMADMIRLGAYTKGTDAQVDAAIAHHGHLASFLHQGKDTRVSMDETFDQLQGIVEGGDHSPPT